MRNWFMAAALVFAAPAWAQPAQVPATPPEGTVMVAHPVLPAPAPEGALVVAANRNGQSVDATVGAALAVQLRRTPSVGSNWVVTTKPDFLDAPEQLSGPTISPSRPPVLGAPVWQVFVFPVTAAG